MYICFSFLFILLVFLGYFPEYTFHFPNTNGQGPHLQRNRGNIWGWVLFSSATPCSPRGRAAALRDLAADRAAYDAQHANMRRKRGT